MIEMLSKQPPGHPGITPHWASSAKTGIGTSTNPESRVWFSISHGILDEIYHPFIDCATTRDFGLLISNSSDFFSEEKRDTIQEIVPIEQGVPGYRLINTCKQNRYPVRDRAVLSAEWQDHGGARFEQSGASMEPRR